MSDPKQEWLFLIGLEQDTYNGWSRSQMEMYQRPKEKEILVDDIRRAVEHEFALRRCASWLERKLLENHEYDMTRIVGSHPERHLAMYEARLKHKESLVQYLCLRIAGKHAEAENLYETVLALSEEVRRCSTLAWDW
ncbi:hypothetical protein N7541_006128 [Penicillium brevicompactum]|uniref:Uncharacterized protein n=1 Tax=Penicillium brevicompactum TaxID=5074 RepID=A0A9W9R6K8_PENBR|nr:hypothetical protein N7541_006128 [Penicillium brevicompactum]